MSLKKVNDKLNDKLNEETQFISSLTTTKYFFIYIPILFLLFAIGQLVTGFLFDYPFNWISVLIQAVCFAIFFRIFHYVRKLINQNFKNKHN